MPPSFIPEQVPPFNVNLTIGAFELGTLFATTLFGATCIQVYIYFERYPKDRRLLKFLVCQRKSALNPYSLIFSKVFFCVVGTFVKIGFDRV